MSLLDGLKDCMANPLFDSMMESDMDADFDFETALEAAIDKQIELSEEDIAAILDDENPDNVVSDITKNDEKVSKIAEDSLADEMATLESMLDALLESSADLPEQDDPSDDPENPKSLEGCSKSACEMDDGADNEPEDSEDEDDDDYVSLDSLLDTVFKHK